jgi:hypothetical protein
MAPTALPRDSDKSQSLQKEHREDAWHKVEYYSAAESEKNGKKKTWFIVRLCLCFCCTDRNIE